MILLHQMDAPRDLPGLGIRRGEPMYHLLADVPGAAGTAELLTFARRCGGRDTWLQAVGTYREHFDLFGPWAEQARALGAQPADDARVGRALAAKRAAMAGQPAAVPTLTGRQMRVVDDLTIAVYGVALAQMMELAGARLAEVARRLLGGSAAGRRVVVLVGPGHNGGGGLAAARHLANAGAHVNVHVVPPMTRLDALSATQWRAARAVGIAVAAGGVPAPEILAGADLIVDALLGYSLDGAPRGDVAAAIQAANASGRPILALDLPSGLGADDDGPRAPTIRAAATLALALPKRGLALGAAAEFAGDLWLADIGVPRRALKQVGAHVGPLFAAEPVLRLGREPLAGGLLPSVADRLVIIAGRAGDTGSLPPDAPG